MVFEFLKSKSAKVILLSFIAISTSYIIYYYLLLPSKTSFIPNYGSTSTQITAVKDSITDSSNEILFEKDERWGPCAPHERPCSQKITLYRSGILKFTGNKTKEDLLNKITVDKILSQIDDTGVIEKNCDAPITLDYSATYKIKIEGKEKTIQYPGCHIEMRSIESLIY